MSAISEIKDAIQKKIAGQGSQVDIGNGLPSVLNGMADLIQKSQELTTKGYKLLLPVVEYDYEETPELPEAPEEGNYFALALLYEEDVMYYQIWTHNEGEDWGVATELLYIITKGSGIDDVQNLLVSNHAVKEYVEPVMPIDVTNQLGVILQDESFWGLQTYGGRPLLASGTLYGDTGIVPADLVDDIVAEASSGYDITVSALLRCYGNINRDTSGSLSSGSTVILVAGEQGGQEGMALIPYDF